jgi:hypothetical protein
MTFGRNADELLADITAPELDMKNAIMTEFKHSAWLYSITLPLTVGTEIMITQHCEDRILLDRGSNQSHSSLKGEG